MNLTFIAAITSFKQQVEGLSDLDKWVELLIRLLCAVPGWTEKNVQVFNVSLLDKSVFFCFPLWWTFLDVKKKNIKALSLNSAGSATGY